MNRVPAAATSLLTLALVAGCGSSGTTASNPSTPASAATSATTAAPVVSATATTAGTASAATLAATQAFLATLTDAQKSTVQADRTQANLSQWSNLPDQLFQRPGLRMDALSAAQVTAVNAILQAALSPEGYTQAMQITAADGVLAAAGGINLDFGADHYTVRILGTPSANAPYTVQYGGHHLGLNITSVGTNMTLAPSFWGAQPASYTAAAATVEPLGGETTKAFAVIDSLDASEQKTAILTTAIREIVLGAGQDGKTIAPEGILGSAMTADQKAKLLDLVDEWLDTNNTENSAAKLAAAKAELDQTSFAWYGSTEIGNPIYYRVQSPSFVIEFAHQQGQGANAGGITHIHAIYREVGNDYGVALGS